MLWRNLNAKKIGIWGISGKEGQSALHAVQSFVKNPEIIAIDEENLTRLNECEFVIKSPGVSLYRPEILQARSKGVHFLSGSTLFMANKPQQTKVIGITGTKGKSTTSSLLYHTLKTAGLNVAFGGNIGKPLLDILQDEPYDFVVAELSSYQCADFIGTCDMCILTNLFPEHLQWHQSHHQYYLDKCHLIAQAKVAFINGANQTVLSYLPHLPNARFFNTADTFHLRDGSFFNATQRLFSQETLHLVGTHNAENACAVLSIANQLHLDLAIVQQAFKTFQSLPHRLQNIGVLNGITFIDDSISTTPETAIAAFKAHDKGQFITLLLGGFDRGQDYHSLIDFLKPYQNRICLITLPDTGQRIYELARQSNLPVWATSTMQEAVLTAYRQTPKDGTVILSPAAPSYNLYKNFEERGLDFQKKAIDYVSTIVQMNYRNNSR